MYYRINFCLQSYTNIYIATENKDATKDLVYSLLVATNCSTNNMSTSECTKEIASSVPPHSILLILCSAHTHYCPM